MGYWGVTNLGYGILGYKICDVGYGGGGVQHLGYGIWVPLCNPPPNHDVCRAFDDNSCAEQVRK